MLLAVRILKAERRARQRGFLTILWLALFFLALPVSAVFGNQPPGLAQQIDQALGKELHKNRYWQILLHYKPSLTGTVSLIDDPNFFLATNGKRNPESELIATLGALYSPPAEDGKHPRCRFPARYAWLQEQLEIDSSLLPPVACSELQDSLGKVQPRSAVLIFPGTHNNSPASMFGHTLISIDGPYDSRLLSYAVNYSAFTNESNGFAYAVKGIFGLYRGYFSVLPYYQKVKEYNDLERRDVWEYPLNLNRTEVERMFLHIWELKDIYSDYFFFSENCSYNLLFLIEAARPELNLTDQCRPWVIPIDTVRIARRNGLLGQSLYRPSKVTRIDHIASRMSVEEQQAAQQVIRGELEPSLLSSRGLSPAGRARILDLAAETVEFRYFRKELGKEEYRREYLALLTERSKLGKADSKENKVPVPKRPDAGHGSNRLSLGFGYWKDDAFADFKIRPAYHNLLDSDDGYLAGSQIDFANLVLRYYPSRDKIELQALDLISIFSISPRNRFFQPTSWKVDTGFRQKTFGDGSDHLVYALNPGGGFAWQTGTGLGYLLLETDLQLAGRFRDGMILGFGGSAGLLKNLSNNWKLHLWGRGISYPLGEHHQDVAAFLEQSFRVTTNSQLALELSRHKESGVSYSQAGLSLSWYW